MIKTLWENVESILSQSASCKKYGINERYKLKQVYTTENIDELHQAFEKSAIKIIFDPTIHKKHNLDETLEPVVVPLKSNVNLDEILMGL